MSTVPLRIDAQIVEAAKAVGAASSRSAAQQVTHWARIGQALEDAPGVSARDIQRVLAGEHPYDVLCEPAQTVVRARWDKQIEDRIGGFDFAAEFADGGVGYTESDSQGNPVIRRPAGRRGVGGGDTGVGEVSRIQT